MSQIELVSDQSVVKKEKITVFQRFCSNLRNPIFTENNHVIASVNVVCYDGGSLRRYWGEILLITHGYGFGHIRISEGEEELFNEEVYDLLESPESEYSAGRSIDALVIEMSASRKTGIYRIDVTEDVA